MPTVSAAVGQALAGMLSSRGIEFDPGQTVEGIDPAARELGLASGERVSYDLLLGVPPHRPPDSELLYGAHYSPHHNPVKRVWDAMKRDLANSPTLTMLGRLQQVASATR